jgi:rhodanese-related sulfurtransferase
VKGTLTIALATVCFAGIACAEEPSGETLVATRVTSAELVERIAANAAPFVLDVRTPEEFASGHVPGAVNIPHTELAAQLSSLPTALDTELVVLCERGGRAAAAEQVLREHGYTHVRDLEGHMRQWRAEQLPTE